MQVKLNYNKVKFTISFFRMNLLKISGIILFILLWHIISLTKIINPVLFPTPLQVLQALKEYWKSGEMRIDLLTSLWRAIVGFIIGSFLGIAIGLITGRIKFLNLLTSPVFNFIRALPPVAILPLFIIWFGINDNAKIITIAFGCFFPVWLNTNLGASRIPQVYLNSAKLLTGSRLKTLLYVELPATLPYIISGLRLSIAMAFIMVFISELAGSNAGIGFTISNAQMAYKIDLMIAALCLLAGIAALIDWLIKKLSSLFFPWLKANTI